MSTDWEHYRKRKIRREQKERKQDTPRPPRIRPGTKLRDLLEEPRTPSKP